MRVGVYSLQKVLYQGDAESVNCQTAAGEITILDHHRPLISILKKGVMKIIDQEKKEHYIPVSSGFLEVRSGDEAKFLVEEEAA
jgi:F0F1-type ATP synthase epsilon subunit